MSNILRTSPLPQFLLHTLITSHPDCLDQPHNILVKTVQFAVSPSLISLPYLRSTSSVCVCVRGEVFAASNR